MDIREILTESITYTRETFEGKWVRWLIFIILGIPMALFPIVFDTTKIMDSKTASFHWELIAWDQVAIVIIAALLFSFCLSGYMVRIYRGTKPAPDFDSWGDLILDGIKMQIVSLLWFLPAIIVIAAVMALAIFGMASGGSGMMASIAIMLVGLLVAMVLILIIALFSVIGVIRFARTGSIREGLSLSKVLELIGRIGWGKYIVAVIILVIVMLIFGVMVMIVSLIPYVGVVIKLIITPVFSVLSARYYTLLYDEAGLPPEQAGN